MRNNVTRGCDNILQHFQILINFMHKGLLCKYLANPEYRYAKITHWKYFFFYYDLDNLATEKTNSPISDFL